MQTENVKTIDNKSSDWAKWLGFYEEELNIFKERLDEVAAKNTAAEIVQMIEHFQNQFLIQAENIDILQHDINEHVHRMAKEIQQHAGHIDRKEMTTHASLNERFEAEVVIFKDLKEEFMKFLGKVM